MLVRPLPAFPAWAAGNSAPTGTLTNGVATDKEGGPRATAARDAPGAWVLPGSGALLPAPPPARRPPPPQLRRPPPSTRQPRPPPPRRPPSNLPPPTRVPGPPPLARPSPPSSHDAFWLPTGQPFSIGTLTGMTHLWVDPAGGADGAGRGGSRATALRTLATAWQRVPARQQLTGGWHIHIMPGTLTPAQSEPDSTVRSPGGILWGAACPRLAASLWEVPAAATSIPDARTPFCLLCPADCQPPAPPPPCAVPNYWESRWGTRAAPIIIQAAEGPGTVTLASMNVYDVRQAGAAVPERPNPALAPGAVHVVVSWGRPPLARKSCPVPWGVRASGDAVAAPAQPLLVLPMPRRHLYLISVTLQSAGDVFHCEQCTHLLLRNVTGVHAGSRALGRCRARPRLQLCAATLHECLGLMSDSCCLDQCPPHPLQPGASALPGTARTTAAVCRRP